MQCVLKSFVILSAKELAFLSKSCEYTEVTDSVTLSGRIRQPMARLSAQRYGIRRLCCDRRIYSPNSSDVIRTMRKFIVKRKRDTTGRPRPQQVACTAIELQRSMFQFWDIGFKAMPHPFQSRLLFLLKVV